MGFARTPGFHPVNHGILADALAMLAIGRRVCRKHAKDEGDEQAARFHKVKVPADGKKQ